MKLHNYWYMGDCVGQDPPGEDMIIGDDGGGQLDGEGGGGNPIQCPRQGIVATFYVWSGNEIVAEYDIRDSLRYQYVYASGRRVATITCVDNGYRGKVFHHYDALGSMRRSTAGSGPDQGIISQELEYDAWGRIRVQSSTTPEFTFTGQQWDDDLGINLFYLRNRYYDPKIGRFTTPDPLVADLNPYSYANNNPVMLVDPSGLSGIHFETTVWRNGSMIDPARYRSMWGARNNYLGTAGSSGPDIIEWSSESNPGAMGPNGRSLFERGGGPGGFRMGFSLRLATSAGSCGGSLVPWEMNMIRRNIERKIARIIELRLAEKARKMRAQFDEEAGGEGMWCPDADGVITAAEAFVWWKTGEGASLTVPLSSVDLSGIAPDEMNPVGVPTGVDILLNPSHLAKDIESAKVYGGLSLTLQADGTVISTGGYDDYDCELRETSFFDITGQIRNVECGVFFLEHGSGTPFRIYLTGSAPIGE